MDITTITDTKELKSLAYDQMVTIEQAQTNLRLINQRIAQIQEQQLPKVKTTDKKEESN